MSSIYRKPEVEVALMRIYAEKLGRWPVPYQEIRIKTSYGDTYLVASGPTDGFPLLLLPGLAVTAMMWLPNIVALSQNYRCYAADVIGDFGRSKLSNPYKAIRTGKGYSAWLTDMLDGIGIERTHLLAASNGGYAALNLAVDVPQRIGRMALLAPSGIDLTLRKVLPKIIHYLLFPNSSNRDQLIEWFIGTHPTVREDFYQQMWWGLQGLPKTAIPILFPAAKLKRINIPTLFVLGENDPTMRATSAQSRIKKYVPHAQTMVIPGVSHVLNYEAADVVEKVVLRFLGEGSDA
jgi:pimeloyl-ACP methyl ester carboxylesterase